MHEKIPQEIIDLYDAFTHGAMERRAFMKRLAQAAGGGAAAAALLPMLANDYAKAAVAAENDPRLDVFTARFDAGAVVDMIEPEEIIADGAPNAGVVPTRHLPFVTAYGARPKDESILPAVIVIHENRGLNPHIKDVARRIALEGFHAFAVDMLSPFGGTPEDEDKAREMIGKLDRDITAMKLAKIAEHLELLKTHQRKVGAIGFCWGGGMVNALAAKAAGLDAGVVYYGRQASAGEAAAISASMLFHYAGEDQRINAGIEDYETALSAAGVSYESHVYDGAQHAFNNDANAARYDKGAAELAWSRTIAFLKEKLA